MSTANRHNQKSKLRGSFTIQKQSANQESGRSSPTREGRLRLDDPATTPVAAEEAGSNSSSANVKQRQQQPTRIATGLDLNGSLDTVLLNISNSNLPELVARDAFRKNAIAATKSIGAGHIVRAGNGQWILASNHSTGRVPDVDEFGEEFTARCDKVFLDGGVQVHRFEGWGNAVALLAPVGVAGVAPEILLVVGKNADDVASTIPLVQRIVAAMQLWLKSEFANSANWQLNSLASMTELVSIIEASDTVKLATDAIVNELTRELNCSSVVLGLVRKQKMRVEAVSGIHKIDRGSETCRNYRQALRESLIRDRAGVYPAIDPENAHLLLCHKQVAAAIHNEGVYSQPLISTDGNAIGAWLFTGTREQLHDVRFSRFVDTACPKLANAIQLLQRAEKSRSQRALTFVRKKTSIFTRLMIPLGILAFGLLMMMPITYRVRCNGTAEPVSRRFAVAPFDGLVVSGFVEPGDFVKKDQVLAEIDGRSIRWELSGVNAERRQSIRQREIELAKGNIPETFLAELENERLTSQEKILKFKSDNLEVKSPIDGVVLSGSLERAVAASITTGQVLFEIGPVKPIKIEIAIPANEITQTKLGHDVTIWIEGQEDRPLAGQISRIHPRSETRDAKNVFIAEIEVANEDEQLRPGMKGTVRVDGEKCTLGWAMFHKPVDYVRSRFTWW